MIIKIFQNLLQKFGKSYIIDPTIPKKLFYKVLMKRSLMLLKGICVYRRLIFVGKKVQIKNLSNINLGCNVTLESYTILDGYAKNKIEVGNNVKFGSYSILSCTSHLSKYGKGFKIGNNSSCGRFCEFGSAGGIEIGNDVIMGSYISFHSENHYFNNTSKLIREQGVYSQGIVLGNNIWVGAKVTFLDGVVIGNNCVIAAGSVVKGVFPDNVVIGGVPAKILKEIQ